jgi:hypothetical protein
VANEVLGPCDACIEGKMTAPPEPLSTSWHDTGIGHTMYYDIYPLKHETIGGNKLLLIGTESSSGYVTMGFSQKKDEDSVFRMVSESVAELNQYGHRVRRAVFDHEATLLKTFPRLRMISATQKKKKKSYYLGPKPKTSEQCTKCNLN